MRRSKLVLFSMLLLLVCQVGVVYALGDTSDSSQIELPLNQINPQSENTDINTVVYSFFT
jgi:hypothetical protein